MLNINEIRAIKIIQKSRRNILFVRLLYTLGIFAFTMYSICQDKYHEASYTILSIIFTTNIIWLVSDYVNSESKRILTILNRN